MFGFHVWVFCWCGMVNWFLSFDQRWCYGVANLLGILGIFFLISLLVLYDGNGRYPGMELYNRPNSMPS